MPRTLVWRAVDVPRMEIARADRVGAELDFDADGYVGRYEGLAVRVG